MSLYDGDGRAGRARGRGERGFKSVIFAAIYSTITTTIITAYNYILARVADGNSKIYGIVKLNGRPIRRYIANNRRSNNFSFPGDKVERLEAGMQFKVSPRSRFIILDWQCVFHRILIDPRLRYFNRKMQYFAIDNKDLSHPYLSDLQNSLRPLW